MASKTEEEWLADTQPDRKVVIKERSRPFTVDHAWPGPDEDTITFATPVTEEDLTVRIHEIIEVKG